jgi:hypothetical protein
MHSIRLTFREITIGLGLLRPVQTAEENTPCESARRTATSECAPVRQFMHCWTENLQLHSSSAGLPSKPFARSFRQAIPTTVAFMFTKSTL